MKKTKELPVNGEVVSPTITEGEAKSHIRKKELGVAVFKAIEETSKANNDELMIGEVIDVFLNICNSYNQSLLKDQISVLEEDKNKEKSK